MRGFERREEFTDRGFERIRCVDDGLGEIGKEWVYVSVVVG